MSNNTSHGSIQSLESPKDMLDKAKHDFKRHSDNNDIYSFMDCVLSLNALPEWIEKDDNTSSKIKADMDDLIDSMKYGEIDDLSSIKNKLRLVRLICNHTKHGAKKVFPYVKSTNGSTFTMTFPITFGIFVALGDDEIAVRPILSDIIDYFDSIL